MIFLEQNSKNLDSVARVRERKEGSEDWDVKGAKNQTGQWPYIKTALLTTLFHAAVQAWIHWDEIRGHCNEASKLVLSL